MIAITFALPTESSGFVRCLRDPCQTERNGIRTVRGSIDNREVEVLHTGVGEKACRQRLANFLQDQLFDCLISTGFAGALNDELRVGDLFLGQNFSTVDLKQAQALLSGLSVRTADLLTLPGVIDSKDEREKIARECGAAAVDMETEFIAQACAAHGIPLLSLRVITDTPLQPFPAPPAVLFDVEQQRTHISAFAKFFLAHPNRVPGLVQFAKRIACAKKVLGHALATIVSNCSRGR